MELRDYLHFNNIQVKAFATELGISRVYLGQIKNKKVVPRINLCQRIEKLTNGKVTVKELRSEK